MEEFLKNSEEVGFRAFRRNARRAPHFESTRKPNYWLLMSVLKKIMKGKGFALSLSLSRMRRVPRAWDALTVSAPLTSSRAGGPLGFCNAKTSSWDSNPTTQAELSAYFFEFFDEKFGRGRIRTHEPIAGFPVFKTGAFGHSATLP